MRHEIFEVRVDRVAYKDAVRLAMVSRVYDVRLSLELRRNWGDPRVLCDYAERLIGRQLHLWHELHAPNGREMAQAMLPFWQEAIQHMMVEYEDRMRRPGARHIGVDYGDTESFARMHYSDLQYRGFQRDAAQGSAAKSKAHKLLLGQLNPEQRTSYLRGKTFNVKAQDGKTYELSYTRSFNVKGPDGIKYCGQTLDTPLEDQLLAQKLLLEHEPEKFFRNANKMEDRSRRPDEMMFSEVNDARRF